MPTHKQKSVFKKLMVDSSGSSNVGKAMRESGYSEKTSLTPSKLINSDGWKALMQEYLPDNLLARKHNELLEDKQAIHRLSALNLAYKVKGKYQDTEAIGLPPISIVVKQVEAPERKQVDNETHG
jgi:hypothetical protein